MSNTNIKTKNKTIEEKYQHMSQHEHILHAPNSYIGTAGIVEDDMWIYNSNYTIDNNQAKIIRKRITFSPGLYKIFDEILVNARDHSVKCKSCKTIKVDIDQTKGKISVYNDGDGIDVVMHKETKIMVPSMIFGLLLTSTNYDKQEEKTTGGKNGFGAKLANIYSTEFIVETIDATRKLKFTQVFRDNMFKPEEPTIVKCSEKPYTKITFKPDFPKFELEGITDDIYSLMRKRVQDIAMNTGTKVYFNDELIEENNFQKYIDSYFETNGSFCKAIDSSQERWKIGVVYDPDEKIGDMRISFVNGICTYKGGTHVEHVTDKLMNAIRNAINKKQKGLEVKPSHIKENLIIFVDSVIINPDFTSQTKEELTTRTDRFGSKYEMPEIFIKKVIKTGLIERIIEIAKLKEQAGLKKLDGKKNSNLRDILKLEDANKAGTKESLNCKLIITEGDSAKGFAMSGRAIVGTDYYGVFPLRGKMLNVRETSPKQLLENLEVNYLMRILGLQQNKVYDDLSSLRYGSLIILTDQDKDGSHIKGLIINFIHYFWPGLLVKFPIITTLGTPIVKSIKSHGKNSEIICFYSEVEYLDWRKNNNNAKGWTIKYYKGLGTSSAQEARECFQNIENKIITFAWNNKLYDINQNENSDSNKFNKSNKSKSTDNVKRDSDSDNDSDNENDNDKESDNGESVTDSIIDSSTSVYTPKYKNVCEDAITLAFEKKRANDRKKWLLNYDPHVYLENNRKEIFYDEFINQELIHYSMSDLIRSIPNIMDGFKPSLRKIFYGCVLKNLYSQELKVAQLSGFISENTAYHHGEQSLNSTIIGMAQNFVGSNNINLLEPLGNFGNIIGGGNAAASPRYITTKLNPLSKIIFNKYDDNILTKQEEDNMPIEPKFYAPIIPMILVNGSEGIGTGFSTEIQSYNPRDIVKNIKLILKKSLELKPLIPWYRHFKGKIEQISDNKFEIKANYEIIDENTIHVTELPIGIWAEAFKENCMNLCNPIVKKKTKTVSKTKKTNEEKTNVIPILKDYKSTLTDVKAEFILYFNPGMLQKLINSGKMESKLKLSKIINTGNMHLFNEEGKIKKFSSVEEILKYYCKIRLDLYQKRKEYLLLFWRKELEILKYTRKFIQCVLNKKIIIEKQSKAMIHARLEELDFPKLISGSNSNEPSYNYTNMSIYCLSQDEIDKIEKEYSEKIDEINILESKSNVDLWLEELDEFIVSYDKWDNMREEEFTELMVNSNSNKSKKSARKSKK